MLVTLSDIPTCAQSFHVPALVERDVVAHGAQGADSCRLIGKV